MFLLMTVMWMCPQLKGRKLKRSDSDRGLLSRKTDGNLCSSWEQIKETKMGAKLYASVFDLELPKQKLTESLMSPG